MVRFHAYPLTKNSHKMKYSNSKQAHVTNKRIAELQRQINTELAAIKEIENKLKSL